MLVTLGTERVKLSSTESVFEAQAQFQSSLQLIHSEWKMTDQQGKKIYQEFFVTFLEIFPGFSASSGDQRKLLFGNR